MMGRISAASNYTMDIGDINNVGGHFYGTSSGVENIKEHYKEDLGFNLESNSDEVTTGEIFHMFIKSEATTSQLSVDAGLPTRSELVQNYYNFLKSGSSLSDYLNGKFGADYLKDAALQFANGADKAGELFDEFLKSIDQVNKEYYQANKSFIDNYNANNITNEAKLDFPAGKIVNLGV